MIVFELIVHKRTKLKTLMFIVKQIIIKQIYNKQVDVFQEYWICSKKMM